MSSLTPFEKRKQTILNDLSKSVEAYSDLSPKGAIDDGIRELVDAINSHEGLVTTSSCSGRVSVFVEGNKSVKILDPNEAPSSEYDKERENTGARRAASSGGKGGGGKWLYVSHEPLEIPETTNFLDLFTLSSGAANDTEVFEKPNSKQLIHFKYEPMIIHILTSSSEEAQLVLSAAHEAGFRESGAATLPVDMTNNFLSNHLAAKPISLAVRSSGLAFDNIIGYASEIDVSKDGAQIFKAIVTEDYLRMLAVIANEKFIVNAKRKQRFTELLLAIKNKSSRKTPYWEERVVRKQRKRQEGLQKQALEQRERQQEKFNKNSSLQDDAPQLVDLDRVVS